MKSIQGLLGGIVGALIFVLLHNHFYARTVGVVRMDSIIGGHIMEAVQDDAGAGDMPARFATALDQAIAELRADGIILIVSQAVVSGEPDYTDRISKRVKELMSVQN